jgi:hypothetical protein
MSCHTRDDGDSSHCLHEKKPGGDQICCHCGRLFWPRNIEGEPHGEYLPKKFVRLSKFLKPKAPSKSKGTCNTGNPYGDDPPCGHPLPCPHHDLHKSKGTKRR